MYGTRPGVLTEPSALLYPATRLLPFFISTTAFDEQSKGAMEFVICGS
jgi:hypothetical protein